MTAPTTHCEGPTSRVSGGFWQVPSSRGTVLGLVIDNQAGTSPTFTLIGVGLGIVSGGIGFWLKVRAALRE